MHCIPLNTCTKKCVDVSRKAAVLTRARGPLHLCRGVLISLFDPCCLIIGPLSCLTPPRQQPVRIWVPPCFRQEYHMLGISPARQRHNAISPVIVAPEPPPGAVAAPWWHRHEQPTGVGQRLPACHYPACRPSSSFAIEARCTSSGPSASRSVRTPAQAAARPKSPLTPAPP